jgi:hypothetical protein
VQIEQRSTEHLLPRLDSSHEEERSPSPVPVDFKPRMIPALRAVKEEAANFNDGMDSSPQSEGGRQSLVINQEDNYASASGSGAALYEHDMQQQYSAMEQQRKLGFQGLRLGECQFRVKTTHIIRGKMGFISAIYVAFVLVRQIFDQNY